MVFCFFCSAPRLCLLISSLWHTCSKTAAAAAAVAAAAASTSQLNQR
jgi:predicted membrane channel-forming protein YqfA (hemolysin III family)